MVQCKKSTLINRILFLFFLPSFRLLDITHGQRRDREMSLHLIFEHIHGDLASYLEKCPPPGLEPDRIKVCVLTRFTIVDNFVFYRHDVVIVLRRDIHVLGTKL